MEDMLTMADMGLIFELTDTLDIDRESLRVDLTKEDPGSVKQGPNGLIEIVVPLTTPMEIWMAVLNDELAKLGFPQKGLGE